MKLKALSLDLQAKLDSKSLLQTSQQLNMFEISNFQLDFDSFVKLYQILIAEI
jgi:hypothetical protein